MGDEYDQDVLYTCVKLKIKSVSRAVVQALNRVGWDRISLSPGIRHIKVVTSS